MLAMIGIREEMIWKGSLSLRAHIPYWVQFLTPTFKPLKEDLESEPLRLWGGGVIEAKG